MVADESSCPDGSEYVWDLSISMIKNAFFRIFPCPSIKKVMHLKAIFGSMKGGKSLLLTVHELDFWPILTYRLEESNPATLEWSKRPLHWWKFGEENENIFFGPTYYISLCKNYSIPNTFTLFFAYYDILKIESFWCWFFGWTIWKVLWSFSCLWHQFIVWKAGRFFFLRIVA